MAGCASLGQVIFVSLLCLPQGYQEVRNTCNYKMAANLKL